VPRSIISFGFEDSFDGFEGTTFRGLSDITGRIEDFFLRARTEVGTGIVTVVFKAVEIAGILRIVSVTIRAVEIGAASGRGLEASSSCARHSKTVS